MVGNAHPTKSCYHKLWRKTMPQAVGQNPTIDEILAGLEEAANAANSTTSGSSTSTAVTPGTVFADSDFKDLTNDDDDERLSPNELADFPGGLRALDGNDTIVGSSSAEAINGNLGFDSLLGGRGDDTLRGGRDSDRIFGEDGDDILNGNIGQDLVLGGDGDDLVRGGQDEDLLVGGNGRDTLIGDFGTDDLIGSDGDDLFVLRTETAALTDSFADWIIDFNPADDTIGLTGGLSENDLTFETITFTLDTEINFLEIFAGSGEDIQATIGITTATLDPDGDGTIQGVLIRNNDEDSTYFDTVLGIVLNVTQSDLNNNFETVPDSFLSLG
jgi:Ca2+-binding RTX toxin-like protein